MDVQQLLLLVESARCGMFRLLIDTMKKETTASVEILTSKSLWFNGATQLIQTNVLKNAIWSQIKKLKNVKQSWVQSSSLKTMITVPKIMHIGIKLLKSTKIRWKKHFQSSESKKVKWLDGLQNLRKHSMNNKTIDHKIGFHMSIKKLARVKKDVISMLSWVKKRLKLWHHKSKDIDQAEHWNLILTKWRNGHLRKKPFLR